MKFRRPYYEFSGEHRTLTYRPSTAESKRSYTFPGGDVIEIDDVISARVSRHGNHEIDTAAGMTIIIPWGWISLAFPTASKTTPDECKGNPR